MAKRWTKEEETLLLRLREEGFPTREMVRFFEGRTAASIRTRAAAIAKDKLRRKWTEEEKECALRLKAEGKPNKYIAKTLDRSVRAIEAFLARTTVTSEAER